MARQGSPPRRGSPKVGTRPRRKHSSFAQASLQLWKLSRACFISMMSSPARASRGFIRLHLAVCGAPHGFQKRTGKPRTPLFPPCFFSVILPSRKLHKYMIYLSYFKLWPNRASLFLLENIPVSCFFSVLSTGFARRGPGQVTVREGRGKATARSAGLA